jgi:hypothetical protein
MTATHRFWVNDADKVNQKEEKIKQNQHYNNFIKNTVFEQVIPFSVNPSKKKKLFCLVFYIFYQNAFPTRPSTWFFRKN